MYDDHPVPANPSQPAPPGAWVPPAQPEWSPWSRADPAAQATTPMSAQPPTQPMSAAPAPQPYGYPPPSYQPQWPAAPLPPAPRRVGIAVAVAIAVVAAVVGCGGGLVLGLSIHSSRAGTTATAATGSAKATGTAAAPSTSGPVDGPSATGSVPPTPSVALGNGAGLLAKILPMPAGAKAVTVSGSTGGIMTLDQFVQKEFTGSQSARGQLQARDFRVAAQRNWLDSAGVEVHIQLVQFGTAIGAEGYTLSQSDAYDGDPSVTGQFTVPGATHGAGFEESALDKAGNRRAIVIAQDGTVVVYIFLFTPGNFDRAGDISLMQRQLAALAG